MRRRVFTSLLLGAFVAFAGVQSASARVAAPSFALRPVKYNPALPETESYFVLAMEPGATIRRRIRVTNVGTAAGTLELYAVDATTGRTSGTVYKNRTARRRDVGRWIRLSKSTLKLGPGRSKIVSFSITVPAHATPGDHVGGIVADNQTLTEHHGGALRIKIKHLTIDAVVVRVAGATTAGLRVGRITATGGNGFQYLNIALANTGTVMIKPAGTLLVRSGGKTILSRPLQLDTLIPRTSIDYPVSLPRALRPGDYDAAVSFRYGNRVLVNGQGVGGSLAVSHTAPFHVSSGEYTEVFKGAPPLPRSSPAMSMVTILAFVVAALAVIALAGVSLMFRRRLVPR